MPTYVLFGVSVWIPDFSDLINAITGPLVRWASDIITSIGTKIWEAVLMIAGRVYDVLKPLIDPIMEFLRGLWTKLLAALEALAQRILPVILEALTRAIATLKPIVDALWLTIKPALDELLGFLRTVGAEVWRYIKPWADGLTALIQGDVKPLLGLITEVVQTVLQGITTMFPALQLSLLGLDIGLTGLQAQVQGQPAEFEKILAAKLNEVLNPLAGLGEDVWKGFMKYIVDPLRQSFVGIAAAIDAGVRQIGAVVMDTIQSIAAGGPEVAVERATGIAFILGPLTGAVIAIAQGIELLHPIKYMGIVDTAREIMSAFGIPQFTTAMFGLLTIAAIEAPVRQGLAMRYRPALPDLNKADDMLAQRNIGEGDWRRIYALHGWKDQHIDAWYRTMWEHPSDRLIIAMAETGEIEPEWLLEQLLDRKYTPDTAARIMRHATKKALEDEIKAIVSEVQSDLAAGTADLLDADQELSAVGILGKQKEFRLKAMQKRIVRGDIKDKINTLTSQAKENELTVPQYRAELIALGLRMPRVTALVEKEELRRKPRVEKPKETKRQLAISFYRHLFIEGTIDEPKLRRYLSELTPPLKAEDLELIVTDAKIARAKALEAAAA